MRSAVSICRPLIVLSAAILSPPPPAALVSAQLTLSNTDVTTVCPDGHRCSAGSRCTKTGAFDSTTGLEEYRCDCDLVTTGNACVYADNVVCVKGPLPPDPEAMTHYCVNQGWCETVEMKDDLQRSYAAPGCICTEDWEGPHCQYVKGTWVNPNTSNNGVNGTNETIGKIEDSPNGGDSGSGGGGLSAGAIAGITIGALVGVCCIGFLVFRFLNRDDDPPSVVIQDDYS
mmetsp:Transcript_26819/g.54893  ORF Transcript_26819/g.54893 Transcript_26819/m.54893 type:complete len:229 (-) Transcript_26819:120-806(-)|eukprot:CAMPEP_0183293150 /NCGR_PEP_ID=MMETSP0160_2-20130417/1945_1 /TAXON_ID=2839 ORGANISM="Odontella Sinensis, Strain Grunow 1884" /NCGR_SAMPLE_ID=MMETSP0160_2 /ASSEMBLY_ACC=CAM_ASM_000250 /LENGTH=228 /DNA_ID=CAMNT_0025454219 /DNA_START=203 /DNA_END=889 /DNA_ORIENTATION=+